MQINWLLLKISVYITVYAGIVDSLPSNSNKLDQTTDNHSLKPTADINFNPTQSQNQTQGGNPILRNSTNPVSAPNTNNTNNNSSFVSVPVNNTFWYLDRLDGIQDKQYRYPKEAGENVEIYFLDTGVNIQHPVFGGRAKSYNLVENEENRDMHGHGTHVAGIAAMVARKANIIGVRIFNSNASFALDTSNPSDNSFARGINFAVNEIKKKRREGNSLIHMSVGETYAEANQAGIHTSVIAALQEAQKSGITVVAAAGNSLEDACNILPTSNASFAITVANVDKNNKLNVQDTQAPTNLGPCIDVAAYGTNITSSVGTSQYESKTGTSFAAPIITGISAILLSMGVKPSEILPTLQSMSSTNAITEGLKLSRSSNDTDRLLKSTRVKVASLELLGSLKKN
ncbi:peptidase S8/S53 domain-containing protein [Paraphysoderma sedebokerense]|nr:peptidase S8/S53 domain-containing protein [Paraphysoderma sedebokerense]